MAWAGTGHHAGDAVGSAFVSPSVHALRGATTFDIDEPEHVAERVVELVTAMFERNGIGDGDVISVIFTATDDLRSTFPATAARRVGLDDVPLLCARELDIDGSLPRCIRVLMHISVDQDRSALRHTYLHDARALRDDLPE